MCYNKIMEHFLDYFKPEHYDLELCFWRDKDQLTGTVELSGRLRRDAVKLHAVGLDIQEVKWRPSLIDHDSPAAEYDFMPCDFNDLMDGVEIPFDKSMQDILTARDDENAVTLRIKYQTKFNHNMQGCYVSTYNHDSKPQKLIATQFESHYAREAFPCIDEPAAKATFDLTLILPDYDERDVVLANTSTIGQTNGKFEFATTPRMSTYLLAWVIGPLKSVSDVTRHGVKVTSYGALNQPTESLLFANQVAVRSLDYYRDLFGVKYSLPKLDQVALPDFEAGAMENWGLVTYRESMMLAGLDATLDTKRSVAVTVAHELSHQWFGDLVTMQWWDDLWLNESFATIMEYYAVDHLYPEFHIWEDFFTSDCLAALRRDALPGVQAVQQAIHHPDEISTLFDGAIVYAKGARLMLMLIRLMGEESFFRGVQDYFRQYAEQNTIGDDLWSCLQPYAKFDVKALMHAWISQPGFPAVTPDNTSQSRFMITGETDDSRWPIPELRTDMSGHYIIKYTAEDFRHRFKDLSDFRVEQRLRLFIDCMLLAKTPAIHSSTLLDIVPKFISEPSAAVCDIIIYAMNDLKLFCPPDSPASDLYKSYLRQVFESEFNDINYGVITDSDALRRRDAVLGVAYYAEHQSTLRHLASMYHGKLANLDAELRSSILAAKLHLDEPEVFDAWLDKYSETADPELRAELLHTLASYSSDPSHLDRLVGLLEQPEVVRPQDHIFLYIYLLRNHRTRERVLRWLTTHWDFVRQISGDKSLEDYVRYAAGSIRTSEEAKIFYDFFDSKSEDPILFRAIKMAHAEIDARLELITSDSNGVQVRLQELTGAK